MTRSRWLALLAMATALLGCDLRHSQALRGLASQDPGVRAQALAVVAEAGLTSARPKVRPLLRDRAPRVRRAAVAALGVLGVEDAKDLHALIDRLHDGDLQVRLAAVRVLGDSGKAAARRGLLPVLRDGSLVVRRAAALALEALGLDRKAQRQEISRQLIDEQLAALARAADAPARRAAARMLGLAGGPGVISGLKAALADRSPEVVRQAAVALGHAGGKQALQALLQLAGKRPAQVAAAEGLATLLRCPPPPAPCPMRPDSVLSDAVPQRLRTRGRTVLGQLLEAFTPAQRRTLWHDLLAEDQLAPASEACAVISSRICPWLLAPVAPAVAVAMTCNARCDSKLDALLAKLDAHDDAKSAGAAPQLPFIVLARLTSGHDKALLKHLKRRHQAYRAAAERWLGEDKWSRLAGRRRPGAAAPGKTSKPPPARQRQRALRWLLDRFPERRERSDRDPLLPPAEDRQQLAAMFRALGGRASATTWLAQVATAAGEPLELRLAALAGLRPRGSNLGEATTAAANAVTIALDDKHPDARRAALDACERLGDAAGPRALAALGDRAFEVRAAAARCLGRLRLPAAIEPLLALLRRETPVSAIEALGRLGDQRATKPLLALLREDHAAVRYGERQVVIEALGSLADGSAAPALARELTHPDWRLRAAAATALGRLGASRSKVELELCALDHVAAVRRRCRGALAMLGKDSR